MMIKNYLSGFFLLLATSLFSFSPPEEVTVNLVLKGCNEVTLFQFNGVGFSKIKSVVKKGEVFQFTVPGGAPKFYYVGQNSNSALPIILGTEKNVEVNGGCQSLRAAHILNSDMNTAYRALKKDMDGLKRQHTQLIRGYQTAIRKKESLDDLNLKMKNLDEKKLHLLDSLKAGNPFLAKIAALNTYVSYQHHGQSYDSEVEYIAKEFFQFVNFGEKTYNDLPWVFESFKAYASTLMVLGLSNEAQQDYIENMLKKMPQGSQTHKMALSGIIGVFQQKNHPNYLPVTEMFINTFKNSDPKMVANLQKEVKKRQSFMIGGEAPDFTQKTPEGKGLSLSDLRGKILLLDFWASWCGPCRRENPNVVRLYEKYKDKGFEILGISLDRTRDPWLKAIEKDGLQWPHVSDLKGWKNEVAQAYGVSSIPHTILLDEEGRIIAVKLRGEALAKKLAELLD